jgi:hypothetical protein
MQTAVKAQTSKRRRLLRWRFGFQDANDTAPGCLSGHANTYLETLETYQGRKPQSKNHIE